MIGKIAGTIWKTLTPSLRRIVVRLTQKKFTASVAAVITNEAGEILLLDHVLRSSNGWGFPGGFMNADEQPEAALRREVCEETTLDLKNVKLIRARTIKRHIEIFFTAEAVGSAEIKSIEIKDLKWFAPDALPIEMSCFQQSVIKKLSEK